jgi:hypothetical protein
MCGNSSIRRRFDGTPTEMQKLIGDSDDDNFNCGTDFTIDFLFGYTGYEYRKCTDKDKFKAEIIAAINAGKPVIAKSKSRESGEPVLMEVKPGESRFYVITGYDGDDLIIPEFILYDYSVSPPAEKTEQAPVYDDIIALYIFGDKTERRYTLKDGLMNIRRVMEYNINAKLWDEYLIKLGGCENFPSDDGLDKANPEERKTRAQHLGETCMYMYNIVSFCGAFGSEKLPGHYLYKELSEPALLELWPEISAPHWVILDGGHKTGKLNGEQIWNIEDHSKIADLSTEICEELAKVKEADIKLLEIINQAIAVLDKK